MKENKMKGNKMDAREIIDLETSRENWRAVAVILMLVVSIGLASCISYAIGKANVINSISSSGYTVTRVSTPTNFFYTVERAK